ncbi:hypothetical protein [Streptomyces sp. cf386]|uniref:hypothetical protein n=1 Tax=Streptomyces sp. cf386 TaxID=1761904 RepID=UPI0015A0EB1D|nr:hypothetical protein [Streptomyces sp. cf386]
MKKWREDAQPEWPEVASGSGGGTSPEGSKSDVQATQAFPVTGETEVPGRGPRSRSETGTRGTGQTEILDGWSAFDRPSAFRNNAHPPAGETTRMPAVRDPWAEAEEPEEPARPDARHGTTGSGATHDPHEVTIQLDGVGLQLDNMLRAAKDAPGGGEASDGPVFVDESGRRSRLYRRIGMAVGLACAVYAVVIVATLLSGNSDAPWLPVEPPKEQPAGQVDTPPLPAESAPQPSGTGSVSPGTSPTAGTDATPSPGADATAPGASTSADPGASADPKPSPTKTTVNPGTNPTPDPEPTTQPTTPDPDPSPTDGGGPTEEPTDPATTDEPATGTVANGPNDPSPIAQEPDTSAPAPAAPSPEYTL